MSCRHKQLKRHGGSILFSRTHGCCGSSNRTSCALPLSHACRPSPAKTSPIHIPNGKLTTDKQQTTTNFNEYLSCVQGENHQFKLKPCSLYALSLSLSLPLIYLSEAFDTIQSANNGFEGKVSQWTTQSQGQRNWKPSSRPNKFR